MTTEILALHAAVALASFFQSITGIGFGMIAGPVVLLVLNAPSAVVVTTLLNWLVALALLPLVWSDADRRLGGRLLAGAIVGLPPGAALLWLADVVALKLGAAVVIGSLTAMMVLGGPGLRRPGWPADLATGGLGGTFGACIAVPGPTVSARLVGLGLSRNSQRATMLLFFALVSPAIVGAQAAGIGLDWGTLRAAGLLAPATLAGLLLGHMVAGHVSERLFRGMVILLLFGTALSLLVNALWTLAGGQP